VHVEHQRRTPGLENLALDKAETGGGNANDKV
jgi:hypothetical protein